MELKIKLDHVKMTKGKLSTVQEKILGRELLPVPHWSLRMRQVSYKYFLIFLL